MNVIRGKLGRNRKALAMALSPASALLASLALAATGLAGATPRIVAVGDVHGAAGELTAVLTEAGLLDADRRWSGGNAILVQTGDLLDRGPGTREVLDLLQRLEGEARSAGGRVEVLLGNHEAMNLVGDWRYVSDADYACFADPDSEGRRREALAAHLARRKKALAAGVAAAQLADEAAWLASHPPGFVERALAFAPEGRHGSWLRGRHAIVEIDGNVFVHGGVSPEVAGRSVADLDRAMHEELERFDAFVRDMQERGLALPGDPPALLAALAQAEIARLQPRGAARADDAGGTSLLASDRLRLARALAFAARRDWLTMSPDGPLWFRGFAQWSEQEGLPRVTRALESLGARRFVAGHTPDHGGAIEVRFGGRVLLIDTGMLGSPHYPGGQATALEIEGDTLTEIAKGRRRQLLPPQAAGSAATATPVASAPPASPATTATATLTPPPAAVPSGPQPAAAPRAAYLGPDGKPLRFREPEDVVAFLSSARVVSTSFVGSGITRPKKLLLEHDQVQAHAVFRYVNRDQAEVTLSQSGRQFGFRDTYLFELAAYQLDRLMGLDRVPPVVRRRVAHQDGALQIWIEGAMTGTKRAEKGIAPSDPGRFAEEMQVMDVWDNLIENTDRNLGNFLVGDGDRVWLIDHTRAFRRSRELPKPETAARMPRWLWDRLLALDPEAVTERLRPYLRKDELKALLARRERLIELVRERIAAHGEASVFGSSAAAAPR